MVVLSTILFKKWTADKDITDWVAKRANALLKGNLHGVKRFSIEEIEESGLVEPFDYINHYVNDLENVIDMQAIANAKIRIGVDPMGGAGNSLLEAYCKKNMLRHYRCKLRS